LFVPGVRGGSTFLGARLRLAKPLHQGFDNDGFLCGGALVKGIAAMGSAAFGMAIIVLTVYVAGASAAPYVPTDDAVVLERLPERGDPGLRELKRMRAALTATPRDLDAATLVARRAIDASRATGDPRFLGQAQAALSQWWTLPEAPPSVVLLRATIRQSQHDFDGALADLDRLLRANPRAAQARLTRATVLTVVGRFVEAQSDCRQLAAVTTPLVAAGCMAPPTSLSGEAELAYTSLLQALDRPGTDVGAIEWALTLAAEIAQRRGDTVAAEQHFAAALALDPSDAYLKGAYADFLLDSDRPREVLPLVASDIKNDALLLRLLLAEQRVPDQRDAFAAHRAEMAARFDAARRRGDSLHRREEARFRLAVEGDSRGALTLARDNWNVQREPADLRILVDAARAANDAPTLRLATDWIAKTRLEDKAVVAALAGTR
jgi:tetratricopeptide (TPR) repeat protein